MKILCSVGLLLILSGGILFSIVPNMPFQSITVENGLSQNIVYDIFQDSRGFMWFCTDDGLNRYDGYSFRIFNRQKNIANGFSHNRIYTLVEDRPGIFWVGTLGGGLNRFDSLQETFEHYVHDPLNASSLSHNSIRRIIKNRDGTFWIATDNGLNRFDPASNRFDRYLCQPAVSDSYTTQFIQSIYQDQTGVLWLATDDGLCRFDPKNGTIKHYKTEADPNDIYNLNRINDIIGGPNSDLWLGTESGLLKFDIRSGIFGRPGISKMPRNNLFNSRVNCLFATSTGRIWIGTEYGIFWFNSWEDLSTAFQTGSVAFQFLKDKFIIRIYEDPSGIIWIGSYTGIYKYDPKSHKFASIDFSISEQGIRSEAWPISSICEDHFNRLWVGTYGKGLIQLDPTRIQATFFTSGTAQDLKDNTPNTIIEDRNHHLWIGTFNGLQTFDLDNNTFDRFYSTNTTPLKLSDKKIVHLFLDKINRVWIGTQDGGLNILDPLAKTIAVYTHDPQDINSLSHNYVTSICQDRQGYYWIGTYGGGLNRFDVKKEEWISYRHQPHNSNSLSNDKVYFVHEDRSGILWIGTNSGGLDRLDPRTGIFRNWTKDEGLPNNVIFSILEDRSGCLWMSTNRGISRFDPRQDTFKNYGIEDGVAGNEFMPWACHQNNKGEMFFGSFSGLTYFSPDGVQDNPFVPPIVFTAINVFNRKLLLDGDLTAIRDLHLTYRDRTVGFEFSALCYSDPSRNQYSYRIEGLNDEWIYLGYKHEIIVSNLKPGTYVLRVKGSNNDGIWNEKGLALTIHISPPFWQTWWFRLILGLLILMLFIYWYRSRMERLANRIRSEAAMEQFFKKFDISQREKDIVFLLLKGKSNKEIEDELYISIGTVKNHIYNIFQKLGIKNRAQLITMFKNLQLK